MNKYQKDVLVNLSILQIVLNNIAIGESGIT